MAIFLFNDCLPKHLPTSEYATALAVVLREYIKLSKSHDMIIVTPHNQDEQSITSVATLKTCINEIKDPEIRTYAYRAFNKYPISKYIDEDKYAERIVTEDFKFKIKDIDFDASNLAIMALANEYILSLPIDDGVKVNRLEIKSKNEILRVNNLFGHTDNTIYIDKTLEDKRKSTLNYAEKLKEAIGGKVEFCGSFEDEFNRAIDPVKKDIIDIFGRLIQNGALYPPVPDYRHLKDVTPQNGKRGPIYEARTYGLVSHRVYFCFNDNTIKLLSLCGKAGNQNLDIKMAYNKIPK